MSNNEHHTLHWHARRKLSQLGELCGGKFSLSDSFALRSTGNTEPGAPWISTAQVPHVPRPMHMRCFKTPASDLMVGCTVPRGWAGIFAGSWWLMTNLIRDYSWVYSWFYLWCSFTKN